MQVFSELNADNVSITNKHYEEFCLSISNSTLYEAEKVNDLIYYLYDICKEFGMSMTKRRLLLKIADLTNEISFDNIMGLKHYELKRLLNADRANYQSTYFNILVDNSGKFDLQ